MDAADATFYTRALNELADTPAKRAGIRGEKGEPTTYLIVATVEGKRRIFTTGAEVKAFMTVAEDAPAVTPVS